MTAGSEFFLDFSCNAAFNQLGTGSFHDFWWVYSCRTFGSTDPAGCTGSQAWENIFGRGSALEQAFDNKHSAACISRFPAYYIKDRTDRTAGSALHTFVN